MVVDQPLRIEHKNRGKNDKGYLHKGVTDFSEVLAVNTTSFTRSTQCTAAHLASAT
jgi:hypothetical protein